MTAGRPRKPTPLHAVQGTYRRDRHGDGGPEAAPASLKPPRWLHADGRRVWRDLAPKAHALGLLTEMDVELFAHACAHLAVARRQGSDSIKALDMANKILARFGFTPSDRAKLRVTPKNEDPFEDFLTKRAK